MINAKEARALYDQSGAEADKVLAEIEPKVIAAAQAGKQSINFYIDSTEVYDRVILTPIYTQVVEKLHQLGYQAGACRYGDAYIPPGLADDDGDGPKYQNYGLYISW